MGRDVQGFSVLTEGVLALDGEGIAFILNVRLDDKYVALPSRGALRLRACHHLLPVSGQIQCVFQFAPRTALLINADFERGLLMLNRIHLAIRLWNLTEIAFAQVELPSPAVIWLRGSRSRSRSRNRSRSGCVRFVLCDCRVCENNP